MMQAMGISAFTSREDKGNPTWHVALRAGDKTLNDNPLTRALPALKKITGSIQVRKLVTVVSEENATFELDKLGKDLKALLEDHQNTTKIPGVFKDEEEKLTEMREERKAYAAQVKEGERVVAELKDREEALGHEIAKALREMGGGTKLSGQVATFSPGVVHLFPVDDWDAYYDYIRKNDAFDLLERRPARAALKERLDQDDLPPGIRHETKATFNLTKSSRKAR